jgi:hypothetical protein
MNRLFIYVLLLSVFFIVCGVSVHAQVIYALRNSDQICTFDYETCNFTDVVNSSKVFGDMAIGVNGEIFGLGVNPDGIYEVNPTTGAAVLKYAITQPSPGSPLTSLTVAPDSTIYAAGHSGLYAVEWGNNAATFLGAWPAGIVPDGDCSVLNGVLYCSVISSSNRALLEVNIANPPASTIVMTWPYINVFAMVTLKSPNCAKLYGNGYKIPSFQWELFSIDPIAKTTEVVCSPTRSYGGFGVALDYQAPLPSCCVTDAGTMLAGSFNFCLPDAATVTHNSNQVLETDDLLRFILFSDPNDTLGSILATGNSPSFAFNPSTMQVGTTYYIAAIAGNNLNGSVNLNDPCLSVSNAVQVSWRPQPSVSFTSPDLELCIGGCVLLNVLFTGSPPFTLNGNLLSGANVVGTFNQAYSANTGTLQVCVPPGVSLGIMQVKATGLSDAFCTCD